MGKCCKNGQVVGHEEKMSTVPITRLRILSKRLRELQHAIIIQVINQKPWVLQEIQTTSSETIIDLQ